MTVRIQPLPAEQWDDTARAARSSLLPPQRANPRDAGNLLATLLRHPDLTAAYLPFNADLLNGSTLSPRTRRHFTDEQRMDLIFTIGGYQLLALAVNTFGVREENL